MKKILLLLLAITLSGCMTIIYNSTGTTINHHSDENMSDTVSDNELQETNEEFNDKSTKNQAEEINIDESLF